MAKRVVISAAGKGTRMKHLTHDRPKHMIEVKGKPFLYYLLSNLEQAGFTDIIVITGYKAQHIHDYLHKGLHKNVRVVNQFERIPEEKYGTAIPLLAARPELEGEDFVAVYGDNLYSIDDLKKFTIDDSYHHVAGMPHQNPSQYGVLITDQQGNLKEIIEKPKVDVGSNIINTGLMKFAPDIFEALERVQPNPGNGEYYLVDALTDLAKKNKVKVQLLNDYWLDFGKPEDVDTLTRFLDRQAEKNN